MCDCLRTPEERAADIAWREAEQVRMIDEERARLRMIQATQQARMMRRILRSRARQAMHRQVRARVVPVRDEERAAA